MKPFNVIWYDDSNSDIDSDSDNYDYVDIESPIKIRYNYSTAENNKERLFISIFAVTYTVIFIILYIATYHE